MNQGYAIYAWSPSTNFKHREFLLESGANEVITDPARAQQRANALAGNYNNMAMDGVRDWVGQIAWETWGIETLDGYQGLSS